jgi:hypothetical protein
MDLTMPTPCASNDSFDNFELVTATSLAIVTG